MNNSEVLIVGKRKSSETLLKAHLSGLDGDGRNHSKTTSNWAEIGNASLAWAYLQIAQLLDLTSSENRRRAQRLSLEVRA